MSHQGYRNRPVFGRRDTDQDGSFWIELGLVSFSCNVTVSKEAASAQSRLVRALVDDQSESGNGRNPDSRPGP